MWADAIPPIPHRPMPDKRQHLPMANGRLGGDDQPQTADRQTQPEGPTCWTASVFWLRLDASCSCSSVRAAASPSRTDCTMRRNLRRGTGAEQPRQLRRMGAAFDSSANGVFGGFLSGRIHNSKICGKRKLGEMPIIIGCSKVEATCLKINNQRRFICLALKSKINRKRPHDKHLKNIFWGALK